MLRRIERGSTLKEWRESAASSPEKVDLSIAYMTGARLYLLVAGLCLAMFLVALDSSILATAIPTITTAFNSLDDVGWYGSAFMIANCACQPLSGRVYTHFSLKWVYLSFLTIFEIGSVICAAAPSSVALIVGRAVCGIGTAGIFSGVLNIIAHTIPLEKRPVFIGSLGSMFAITNTLGPPLGGAITQHLSWRWCFWINLPFSIVIAPILYFYLHAPPLQPTKLTPANIVKLLDLRGFALFVPAVIMLLLAIQWGGNTYPWTSTTVLGLIIGSICTFLVFAIWQAEERDDAMIPAKIATQRTVFFGSLVACFAMGTLQLVLYYLPIWFQVIKGASPTKSGVMNLPLVLGDICFSILGGVLTTKLGYYNPFLLMGTLLAVTGAALLSTFTVDTGTAKWIGYQFIVGAGQGATLQMPLVGIQAVIPPEDLPTTIAFLGFSYFFGGSLILSVAHSAFQNRLTSNLAEHFSPENVQMIVRAGAAAVRTVVSPETLPAALDSYNRAISTTFIVAAGSSGLAFLAANGMQWVSVKGRKTGTLARSRGKDRTRSTRA